MIGFLWLMWVGGAGAASVSEISLFILSLMLTRGTHYFVIKTVWPDLSWCVQFSQCRILQTMMGFAWLAWICVTLLAVLAIMDAVRQTPQWNYHGHRARKQEVLTFGSTTSLTDGGVSFETPRAPMSQFRFPPQPATETA